MAHISVTPRILCVNPNTTRSMTDNLVPLLTQQTSILPDFFTSPTGPASINNSEDCHQSADETLPHLLQLLSEQSYDGILISCYSDHPLVAQLKEHTRIPVIGIFEASLSAALLLLREGQTFGIVSTGRVWEDLLQEAVRKYLGSKESSKFAGVETTGLNATDLHDAEPALVRTKMMEAVKRLIRGKNVGAICLGCAGMAGMEVMVREACIEEFGVKVGGEIRILDGVKYGYAILAGLINAAT